MALVDRDGKVSFQGAVLKTWDKYWLDGMIEEFALVWDTGKHEYRTVTIGYYGSDFQDLIGTKAEIEVSRGVARDILRCLKQNAYRAYAESVIEAKKRVGPGTRAEVIRGRKVPKGTKLTVFWTGERQTYWSRCSGINETELIAGAYDDKGNKVWIKAEYLKSIDPVKSPTPAERRKFIKSYVRGRAGDMVIASAI